MTLVKFSNQMPSLIDRFFNDDLFDWSLQNFSNTNSNLPAVNIKEKDDAFEIEMAAPGFNKEDFKIELNNNLLSISSEKKTENETKENERFTRREFSYQSFMRSFTLPNSIEGEKINAKYENGILNIHIPKKDEAKVKPVKQIEIK
jgi:HSP20 family protein